MYHPALRECSGSRIDYLPKAYPYRFGAFLDDIYWISAEACRIIRALLSSSLTVAEIGLLQGLVGVGFPYHAPSGERQTESREEDSIQGLVVRLKDMGFLESVQGRRSLTWATPKGWRLALGLTD